MVTSLQESAQGTREQPILEQPAGLRLLLACGVLGPLLFIGVFLIEGISRPGYNALRYPVSSLSLGDPGWIQVANFLLAGLLLCAFAIGLWRVPSSSSRSAWGALLLGLAGIGLFGAGLFTTDPVYGYPPAAPIVLAQFSTRGHLHDLFSLLLFAGLPTACFVFARRFAAARNYGWTLYSIASALGMLVTFVLAGKGFLQDPNLVDLAGVYQRLSISLGLIWVALLAFRFMLAQPPTRR